MLDGPGMRLLDGAVVHVGNPGEFDCLILYGQKWRGAASAALVLLLEKLAAIAEFDGRLDREATERLARNEVTSLIIPDQSHQRSDAQSSRFRQVSGQAVQWAHD